MHRLALAVLTTAVAAAPAALCGCAPRATPVRSVVLVVVDTLRADHMSLYGYSRPTTPALERTTSRALIFDRAFATSPWTLPSFASIFTGSEPEEHGAGRWVERDGAPDPDGPLGRINVHGVEKHFTPMDESRATLPEILGRHGYATAAFANNPFLHPIFGLARGFDLYDHESGGDLSSRRADEMVSRTLAWIESLEPGEPFFALLHLFDPHMAYDPPGSTAGRFTSGIESPVKLPFVNTPLARRYAPRILEANRRFIRAAYDEEILFVDTQVGRLLDRLAKLPNDPLVVITADHGEELFDHESFGHGHTLYQELLHVPLLLLGPDVTPGHVDTSVSIADIAPTILDAVGIGVPPEMTGVSLWTAASRSDRLAARPVLAGHTGEGPERNVVIEWPYKLIRTAGAERLELYDLVSDPGERSDLSESEPDRVVRLRSRLPERPADGRPDPVTLDEETRRSLRELGYLEAPSEAGSPQD